MNDYITKSLQALATVKPGNKISTKNGVLTVDKNASAIARWFSGDSRTNTVIIIASLVDQGFAQCVTPVLLTSALQGIENLKVTYQKDYGICMQLDEICNKIKNTAY